MNVQNQGLIAAGYAAGSVALGFILKSAGIVPAPFHYVATGGLALVGAVGHLGYLLVKSQREHTDWLDRLSGEVLRLGDDVEDVEGELRNLRAEVATKEQRASAELVAEVRVLQTLLEQVVASSGSAARHSVLKDSEASSPGVHASATMKSETHIYEIMRNALSENKVDLYLQPVVSLPSRRPMHYECFARVRDASGDIIFPRDFLPVAGVSGLIGTLDNLILFRCIQLARQLGHRRKDVRFFLNISSDSLNDREFFPQFIDYMLSHDLSDRLVFEFSQADTANMPEDVVRQLLRLGKLGYRFSLDHVTDPALDLNALSRQFFEFVKIDAAVLLAGGFPIDAMDLAEAMARKGVTLICSKIEQEKEIIEILDYNIEFGQGYLFGEPRPARRFEDEE